jgi:nuclease HARBI1
MNQLLVALRFYATGTFQLVVGDTFGVSKSTICRTVHRVTRAIAELRDKYVRFPTTAEEQRSIMQLFYGKSRMPGVVGAIDCTHVSIQSPGGEDAEIYRNRKGYFSVNVQLVCDSTGYISDVVARWPGSVHDSTIFDNCRLRALLESGQIEGCLVGDGGYASRRYMLTPINNPTTRAEKSYNESQILARNCIERANGILKRRFPALKYGLRLHLSNVLPVIVATVVLHNIALLMRDDEPDDDQQLHEYMTAKRTEQLMEWDDNDAAKVAPPDTAHHTGANARRLAVIDSHFS